MITLEKIAEKRKERQTNEGQTRYYVRIINRLGHPFVANVTGDKTAVIKFANQNSNPNEGEYAHVYDRKIADEKGKHQKVYTNAPQKQQ
ncbi:MAG: hypothetical protein WD552_02335 [Candidatus Paceibacterota bacterium]